jgi:1-pyrroline-5-carboxylate dehydrogenase
MVGNVCVWKPSPAATLSSYIVYQILAEAGVPPGVIQFVPGPPPEIVSQAISHPSFAALHFTGSTFVFKQLWKDIANNMDKYKGYPRIVGETGGKNFHLVHPSADVGNAVHQTIRATFEYQGEFSPLLMGACTLTRLNRPKMFCLLQALRPFVSRRFQGEASSRDLNDQSRFHR